MSNIDISAIRARLAAIKGESNSPPTITTEPQRQSAQSIKETVGQSRPAYHEAEDIEHQQSEEVPNRQPEPPRVEPVNNTPKQETQYTSPEADLDKPAMEQKAEQPQAPIRPHTTEQEKKVNQPPPAPAPVPPVVPMVSSEANLPDDSELDNWDDPADFTTNEDSGSKEDPETKEEADKTKNKTKPPFVKMALIGAVVIAGGFLAANSYFDFAGMLSKPKTAQEVMPPPIMPNMSSMVQKPMSSPHSAIMGQLSSTKTPALASPMADPTAPVAKTQVAPKAITPPTGTIAAPVPKGATIVKPKVEAKKAVVVEEEEVEEPVVKKRVWKKKRPVVVRYIGKTHAAVKPKPAPANAADKGESKAVLDDLVNARGIE